VRKKFKLDPIVRRDPDCYLFAPRFVAREESSAMDIHQYRLFMSDSGRDEHIEAVPVCRAVDLIFDDFYVCGKVWI
jgi:hypothetical protein